MFRNSDKNFGAILSVVMHVLLLSVAIYLFRNPLSAQIVAAGEGTGDENGEKAIEVGVVGSDQFGFTLPRPVTFSGEEKNDANNEVLEDSNQPPPDDAEILATNKKKPNDEKLTKTDRPLAKQTAQLLTKQPLKGSSSDKSIEVGRSTGSPMPSSFSKGIGIGTGGNLGTNGLPGGSAYGKLIGDIMRRNYNPPPSTGSASQQFVIIRLKIRRDGTIANVVGGRVTPSDIKQRSSMDIVNKAAERAVIAAAANKLPPMPNGFLIGVQEAVTEIWFKYP